MLDRSWVLWKSWISEKNGRIVSALPAILAERALPRRGELSRVILIVLALLCATVSILVSDS
jgi:hypothetical protein